MSEAAEIDRLCIGSNAHSGRGPRTRNPARPSREARAGDAFLNPYAGRTGKIIGMHNFGMSAPIAAVAQHFGFTPGRVVGIGKQAMAAG